MRNFISKMSTELAIFIVLVFTCFVFSGIAFADNINTATAENDAIAGAEINQNFEAGKRPFVAGHNMMYPGIPTFLGPDSQAPQYQDLRTVIFYQDTWNRNQMIPFSRSCSGAMIKINHMSRQDNIYEIRARSKRERFSVEMAEALTGPDATITFLTEAPKDRMFIASSYMTLWSEDVDTTSIDLLMVAGDRALNSRADALVVTGQGCEKVLNSSGWGIGTNVTGATNSGSELVSGGTGYSTGQARNIGMVWIQAVGIKYIDE